MGLESGGWTDSRRDRRRPVSMVRGAPGSRGFRTAGRRRETVLLRDTGFTSVYVPLVTHSTVVERGDFIFGGVSLARKVEEGEYVPLPTLRPTRETNRSLVVWEHGCPTPTQEEGPGVIPKSRGRRREVQEGTYHD